ncbi:MAG TPA: SMP-30/gluconolactonase/LRE family protein [Solirubrobacteraceae bacterium]|nr:SMP-30/gluconolactonase/LRE family protein [Solirubrobacteraceae bacterium]
MGSRPRVRVLPAALAALLTALLAAPAAFAAPDCTGGRIVPRTLASTGDTLEYGIFDRRGRFFYSDQSTGFLVRIDRFGDAPKPLAPVPAPGAMVFAPDGSIIIGTGDSVQNGAAGDMNPMSGLLRVNPDTGAVQTYVTGLGMANGIAMAPDGTIYATNDVGFDVDRVRAGKVDHPWARVYSTNGIVVSPDNRYVYVSQTFAPAAIQRISVADPSQVTPYAVAQGADMPAGPDDMTMDERGNLYVAANGAGQVWKVDTTGTICILAAGLQFPSAVNFGVGSNSGNLYVVAFDGRISELANVRPTPAPGAPPTVPLAGSPGSSTGPTHHGGTPHRRSRSRHRRRHLRRHRHRACRRSDGDRRCDSRATGAPGRRSG